MWSKIKRYFKYTFGPVPRPEKWLFIAGCPNSGTTLLHDLLAGHKEIASMAQEGQYLSSQLPNPRKLGVSRHWVRKLELFQWNEFSRTIVNINRLKREWAFHFNDLSRKVLMEKSPTNAVRLRWLQRHFEPAYFICIYRNGYIVSKGLEQKVGCSIEEAAEQWRVSNEIMLADMTGLTHCLLISYEDLTERTQEVLLQITSFLNVQSFSREQVEKPYNIQGTTRTIQNMNFEKQISKNERHKINRAAGLLLQQLNYFSD